MAFQCLERATAAIGRIQSVGPLGRIVAVSGGAITLAGLGGAVRLGDRIIVQSGPRTLRGEVIRVSPDTALCMADGMADGLAPGDAVRLVAPPVFAPHAGWIGRVIDPDGQPLDGFPLLPGLVPRPAQARAPDAYARRSLGARMATGLAVFDTLLPLARGQRMGLFAGSGVGKSTLLADLARGVGADVVVIGLVGERGRELREFVDKVLGPEGMARTVVVAATSDQAPQIRRRCAWSATAVAEHFRDEGRQVLLLLDSVTRFAEAHREVAVAAGEGAGLRGFPATTGPQIAALCERAGPGTDGTGDITAVYSVLVAGSDMEEPVADMLRGVLDGHVVLDRTIAERGRFPAVDLLRSVSRSLPGVATAAENVLISEARRHLGTFDRAELMIQSGLYAAGSDPAIDAAITLEPGLARFLAQRSPDGPEAAFSALRRTLSRVGPGAPRSEGTS